MWFDQKAGFQLPMDFSGFPMVFRLLNSSFLVEIQLFAKKISFLAKPHEEGPGLFYRLTGLSVGACGLTYPVLTGGTVGTE